MIEEAFKRFALLADLAEEEREEVAERVEEQELAPDETLFREGDEADALALVVSGHVRVTSGVTREAALLGPGTVLGGLSLFAVGPRLCTAEAAEEPVRLIVLRRAAYRRLVEDCPHAACRLAEAVLADLAAQLRFELPRLAPPSVDLAQDDA